MVKRSWLPSVLIVWGILGAAGPVAAQTQWYGYRNETKKPIQVQFLREDGQMLLGPPILLYPNEVRWEPITTQNPRLMLARMPGTVGSLSAQTLVTRPTSGDMLFVIRAAMAPDGRTPVLQIVKQPTKKPPS